MFSRLQSAAFAFCLQILLLERFARPCTSFVLPSKFSFLRKVEMKVQTAARHLDGCVPIRMAGGGSESCKMEKLYSVLCDTPSELHACIQQERGEEWAKDLGTLILFSLGFDSSMLKDIAAEASSRGAVVFFADCYGILGYSSKEGRNIELLVLYKHPHKPPCEIYLRLALVRLGVIKIKST